MVEPAVATIRLVPSVVRPGRMPFLDGLRGLAALYVVIHHAYREHPEAQRMIPSSIGLLFDLGRLSVDVFIVVSGFSLMLGAIGPTPGRLTSISGFLKRRAWRILPPYYAAFVVSLLCIRLVPGMNHRSGSHWDIALPAFSPGVLLSHLLMVHNLSLAWGYKINHALWSVATEAQIYIVFPLVLLPVFRRWGITGLLVVCLAMGIAVCELFPALRVGRLWYVTLFSLGMVAAIVSLTTVRLLGRFQNNIRWGWITVAMAALAAISVGFENSLRSHEWAADLIVGLVACPLLILCSNSSQSKQPRWILSLLEARPVVWLGMISYSLYLIHAPIVAMCGIASRHLSPTRLNQTSFMATAVALSVLGGWFFHLTIEQWFIPKADPRRIPIKNGPVIVPRRPRAAA